MPSTTAIKRLNVLGVGVSAIDLDMAVERIDRWIADGERQYVCVTGVHGVMESQRDPRILGIHNAAGLVTPDGMPLVWLLRLGGHRHADRVYGPDLMEAVFDAARGRAHRHFLYGASEGTLARLRANLERRHPGCRIVGSHAPPFRPLTPREDAEVISAINASGADIVWVGLSTPKQERWMAEHRAKLDAPVLIGVGAAFDFHAGLKRQAPRLVQRSGFEWLFRLVSEPRRLWKRYAVNNPAFVLRVFGQMTRLVHYPPPEEPAPTMRR
ncbi:WecB/TagA/CpsF family glycosyltransferase [Azospirillum sp. sgz302134]